MWIYTMDLKCSKHEMGRDKELLIQNIQDWCENCSRVYVLYKYSEHCNHNYIYNYDNKVIKHKMLIVNYASDYDIYVQYKALRNKLTLINRQGSKHSYTYLRNNS